MNNVLLINNRNQFREWLIENHKKEKECWIKNCKRGKPGFDQTIYYLDAVEEALCFGWIDSVYKKVDGELYQKFTPRKKNSNWTVLNLARVERLKDLGLVTDDGLKVVPNKEYVFDNTVIEDIKKAGVYETFKSFPILYQKIRVSNLSSIKNISLEKYKNSFDNFVKKTKANQLIGCWDDYGRLK